MADETTEPETEPRERKPAFLIKRVRIQGYKSIEFCDVPLEPLTILVGRNASGKSNFLDALEFVKDVLKYGATEAVQKHGGWNSVLCKQLNVDSIKIEIDAVIDNVLIISQVENGTSGNSNNTLNGDVKSVQNFEATFKISIQQEKYRLICVENCVISNRKNKQIGGYHSEPSFPGTAIDPTDLNQEYAPNSLTIFGDAPWAKYLDSHTESIATRNSLLYLPMIGARPFSIFCRNLENVGVFSFSVNSLRNLELKKLDFPLQKNGANLPSVIKNIENHKRSVSVAIQDYFTYIIQNIDSFRVVEYGEFETIRFKMKAESGMPNLEFDAVSMSDGTLRVLASLVAVFQPKSPNNMGVVCIEEPETALHPAAMRALVDAFRDASQWTQIVLTTHSAELLEGREIKPKQILVVRNLNGKTVIAPVSDSSKEIVEKELYTLGELQRMDKLDPNHRDLARQEKLFQGVE
jgi:predicted ATPase